MKKLRKGENCLNCGLKLDKKYNYCPQCGQENTDNKVSLRTLIADTILNYFNFDMLLGRSLLPFLFRPGYLVKEFLEGKRVGHIHPVRLYLIVNFLFFLVFVHTIDLSIIDKKLALTEKRTQPNKVKKVVVFGEKDTTTLTMKQFAQKWEIDTQKLRGDSLANFLAREIEKRKIPIKYAIKESEEEDMIDVGLGADEKLSWQRFVKYIGRKDLPPEAFLDSVGIKSRTSFAIKAAEQSMKIGRNDLSMFILNVVENIPLMMIIMLPLLAFYLKFFYLFSKRLYIEHLVFTFHFQSFNYLLLGAVLLIANIKGIPDDAVESVAGWSVLIWIVYNYFAFKRVYQQSWWFTLFKVFWINIFYITTLSFFLLADLVYSFFTY
ncbi:DUF3667 domain-containing protein [Thermoflexibacter ruber]|uniref:DUF3667 domain-containing protein n=1 Tax=Thermoflexibacter ruber TaxID=1003 RepID=A0A1I2HXU1_9BACT|nr:DUF3667 domain-containing protein [Thermoflexibacter ruber]SFF34328.1 Protein of unknown function [Thermoflexibacter ruber]